MNFIINKLVYLTNCCMFVLAKKSKFMKIITKTVFKIEAVTFPSKIIPNFELVANLGTVFFYCNLLNTTLWI